jgi:uncharacterized protein
MSYVIAMQLNLDQDPIRHRIRAYGRDAILLVDRDLRGSCIVSASQVVEGWPVQSPAQLTLATMQPLLDLAPRIVLLGTVETGQRLPAGLRAALEARGIAVELMELGAACRTYNVLIQEGREVVAGLMLPVASAPEEDTGR